MSKSFIVRLMFAAALVAGLVVATSITADPSNPTVEYVCGSEDNGIKKGPDEDGKVSIKCFEPKGEWKNNGNGKIECSGQLANSPGLFGTDACPIL
jgi:hypothetical protein